MTDNGGLIRWTSRVVWLAWILSWGFGVGVLALLGASLTLGGRFTQLLFGRDGDNDLASLSDGTRWLMVLGLVMAGAGIMLVRALRQILATVATGDPFVVANAGRLRAIGWSLLVLQLLDLPAAMIAHAFPGLGSAAPQPGISPDGWLAVLLTFVLARVFVVGARMRDDLDGTV